MLSGLMKPYDLDSFCDAWSTAPIFYGESSKDGSVDAWLKDIEQGCKERDVPGKLWHAVAQRKMGRHASDRLYEVRKVMMFVTRGQFTWDWPKLKQAMRHMNWHMDTRQTVPFDVDAKSGVWWDAKGTDVRQLPNSVHHSQSLFVNRRLNKPFGLSEPASSEEDVAASNHTDKSTSRTLVFSPKPEDPANRRIVNVPTWLLTVCQTLESLCQEYPKAMPVYEATFMVVGVTRPTKHGSVAESA